jgi:protein TonB
MFNKLDRKKKGFWSPTTVIVSVALHLLLGAGFLAASQSMDAAKQKREELVDFVEIEEDKPKEPEPPKPEPPPPPPPEVEAPPPVVKGTQTLVPPEEPPAKIPDVDPTQTAVKVEDFSGVGKEGGVHNGVENGVAQDASDREAPPAEGTYEISAVEERPDLTNRSDVARSLSRNYPPLLKDAGITGTVTIRMRIMEDGRVDPASISVENSTHDAFGDAARKVVERMRFRPAKVGGRPVKVWITLPVTFQLES